MIVNVRSAGESTVKGIVPENRTAGRPIGLMQDLETLPEFLLP
jgi:hypothetical protein